LLLSGRNSFCVVLVRWASGRIVREPPITAISAVALLADDRVEGASATLADLQSAGAFRKRWQEPFFARWQNER
jgi:hypothetical protein